MANQHKGEIPLLIGDHQFSLKLTSNLAAEAEEFMDGSIFEYDGSLKTNRALFYVMVKGNAGISTIEEAGDLMDEDPAAVIGAVGEAITVFFQKFSPEKA